MTRTGRRPTLCTQDLKERGWTGAMIRDLLGEHDSERPNELRVGRRNRRTEAPVKLYLEERVVEAEATAAFAAAQERALGAQDAADKALETRLARAAEQCQRYVEAYTLTLTPPENADTLTDQARWSHHLSELFEWEIAHSHLLEGVTRADRKRAENEVFEKHRAAVGALYPEEVS